MNCFAERPKSLYSAKPFVAALRSFYCVRQTDPLQPVWVNIDSQRVISARWTGVCMCVCVQVGLCYQHTRPCFQFKFMAAAAFTIHKLPAVQCCGVLILLETHAWCRVGVVYGTVECVSCMLA